MPVREISPPRSSDHLALVDALALEWADSKSQNSEPIIFIERSNGALTMHVTVVWSVWANLELVERSEIIMDAATRTLPPDEALKITVAMGLTPDEARRMGMKFD